MSAKCLLATTSVELSVANRSPCAPSTSARCPPAAHSYGRSRLQRVGLQSLQSLRNPLTQRIVAAAVPPEQETSSREKDGPPAPQQQRSGPATAQAEDEDIDKQLRNVWEDVKAEMKKGADPDSAQLLDSLEYEDLINSKPTQLFRKLADAQLGPILTSMGVDEDPLDFFIELLKLATFLQFVTCGMLFYSTELWGHFDTGEAFRATAGLALGYMTRPFFKVEQILYPVYNALLRIFLPTAEYELSGSSREEVQGTLNKLGITVAVGFLVPQLLFGWTSREGTQLVGPVALGWFMFDICYLAALILTLRRG